MNEKVRALSGDAHRHLFSEAGSMTSVFTFLVHFTMMRESFFVVMNLRFKVLSKF